MSDSPGAAQKEAITATWISGVRQLPLHCSSLHAVSVLQSIKNFHPEIQHDPVLYLLYWINIILLSFSFCGAVYHLWEGIFIGLRGLKQHC